MGLLARTPKFELLISVCVRASLSIRIFMAGDDSRLFRADENSQSGTSFPGGGTSLQSVVSHHVARATRAAIGKEDNGASRIASTV